MIFLTKNPYLKKKLFLCVCVGGGGEIGARVSEFFFTKNQIKK